MRGPPHLAGRAGLAAVPAAVAATAAHEGRVATEQDVQDDAQAPQVAALVVDAGLLAEGLHHLRGHVLRRAALRAGERRVSRGFPASRGNGARVTAGHLRQPARTPPHPTNQRLPGTRPAQSAGAELAPPPPQPRPTHPNTYGWGRLIEAPPRHPAQPISGCC